MQCRTDVNRASSRDAAMELIRLENISKTYKAGEVDVPVLKGVSLSIESGELAALMGASGSGKTTLMNILGCLDRPSGGSYWFDGQDVSMLSPFERARLRSRKIGFVFQSFNLLPRTSALDNTIVPLLYAANRPSRAEARKRARALLERVGLGERLGRAPTQLSGGEQQRVAIARALVNRPRLLLADEPTGNLDSHTSADILQLLQELNGEGLTILLVTHDPAVAGHAQRIIRIRDGQIEKSEIEEQPPSLELLAANYEAPGLKP
jgi:ABC-type lipoprotein export system ATPase subunit